MKKPIIGIFLIIIFINFIVLPLRSLLYLTRIFREFSHPVNSYKTDIDPCAGNTSLKDYEDERLLNYRKIGVECKK